MSTSPEQRRQALLPARLPRPERIAMHGVRLRSPDRRGLRQPRGARERGRRQMCVRSACIRSAGNDQADSFSVTCRPPDLLQLFRIRVSRTSPRVPLDPRPPPVLRSSRDKASAFGGDCTLGTATGAAVRCDRTGHEAPDDPDAVVMKRRRSSPQIISPPDSISSVSTSSLGVVSSSLNLHLYLCLLGDLVCAHADWKREHESQHAPAYGMSTPGSPRPSTGFGRQPCLSFPAKRIGRKRLEASAVSRWTTMRASKW